MKYTSVFDRRKHYKKAKDRSFIEIKRQEEIESNLRGSWNFATRDTVK
jgi:hypothetical protein